MSLIDPQLLTPLSQVLFLVFVGVLCRAIGLITETGIQQIATLVLNLMLPAMLFVAGATSDLTTLAQQGPLACSGKDGARSC
jgi:predicted permease